MAINYSVLPVDPEQELVSVKLQYQHAINVYNVKKNSFIKKLSAALDIKSAQKEELERRIVEMLNSAVEDVQQQRDYVKEFEEVVVSIITDLLVGGGLAVKNTRKGRSFGHDWNHDYLKLKNIADQDFSQLLNSLLSPEVRRAFIDSFFSVYTKSSPSQPINLEVLDQIEKTYSTYLINLLKKAGSGWGLNLDSKVFFNGGKKDPLNATAGFYREACIVQGLDEIVNKIMQKSSSEQINENTSIIQVDLLGQTLNNKNKFSDQDIGITILEQLGNLNCNVESSVKPQSTTYGIQSKSWTTSWEARENSKLKANYYMHVSDRENLFNAFIRSSDVYGQYMNKKVTIKAEHAWLYGADYIASNVTRIQNVLGDNVGYYTGNGFYFTGTLIEKMIKDDYVLAFEFLPKHHKLKNSIHWQTPMRWTK